MPSLSEIGRQRKAQLRNLLAASYKLDSSQEALERECRRIATRKRAVPEATDASRLVNLAQGVEAALRGMVALINDLALSWSSF